MWVYPRDSVVSRLAEARPSALPLHFLNWQPRRRRARMRHAEVQPVLPGPARVGDSRRSLDPGISRSLLASRLRDLEHAGVIERLPGAQSKVTEYHLSDAGRDLKPVVEA